MIKGSGKSMNRKQIIEEIDLIIKLINENYTSNKKTSNVMVLTKLKIYIFNNSNQISVTEKQLRELIDIVEELTVKFSKTENEKLLNHLKAFICRDILNKIK